MERFLDLGHISYSLPARLTGLPYQSEAPTFFFAARFHIEREPRPNLILGADY